jgi:hypothetical protein
MRAQLLLSIGNAQAYLDLGNVVESPFLEISPFHPTFENPPLLQALLYVSFSTLPHFFNLD